MAAQVRTNAPNDIAELEAEFAIMLQATNRSPATIATYVTGVRALRQFPAERGMPTAVDAVAREHIEAAYAEVTLYALPAGGTAVWAWTGCHLTSGTTPETT